MLRNALMTTYAFLLSLLYGVMVTGQVLGFIGLYHALLVVPVSLVVTGVAFWAYRLIGNDWQDELFAEQKARLNSLDVGLIASVLIVVLVIFVLRLLFYPATLPLDILPDDLQGYHAPKALQLVYEHSVWNLNLPYGQFPYGYESLLAFGLLLTGSFASAGVINAVFFVLYWLTVALLILRYTKMPIALALTASLLLCFIPDLYSRFLIVGKNDILLSLTLLIAILHAPVGSRHMHGFGLAMATLLSLATKASGLYILVYLWGLVFWQWWQAREQFSWRYFSLLTAMMFPCGLWVIRNLFVMGELYTREVDSFFSVSIAAQLTNFILYNSGAESIWLLVGASITLVAAVLSLFAQKLRPTMPLLLLIIAATFALTPLSAFHTPQSTTLHIEWRYVLYGFSLIGVLAIALGWHMLHPVYAWLTKIRAVQIALAGVALVGAIGISVMIGLPDLLNPVPERAELFRDPYGTQYSVFDWARENIEHGVVQIEATSRMYLLVDNPNVTVIEGINGVSTYPLQRPDLYLLTKPDYLLTPLDNRVVSYTPFNPDEWELLFMNKTGRIYKRLN